MSGQNKEEQSQIYLCNLETLAQDVVCRYWLVTVLWSSSVTIYSLMGDHLYLYTCHV